MRKIGYILTSFVMLLALATAAPAQSDEAVELRIMTYNVWLGGDQ